jgi:SAM-dependent methyltransferase
MQEMLDSLVRDGNRRLYPSITDPNWLVLRRRREIFRAWIAELESPQLDVLDVGGRLQPYRPLLADRVRRYVAVDLQKTVLVNIVARAQRIPLADNQFDLVVCTQMLEYAPEPAVVLAEIHRVLRPGGHLFLSVPSVSPRDADVDTWRFLPAALQNLLREFTTCEILPEGGSVVGFFRSVNVCLSIFVKYRTLRSIFRATLCPALNVAGQCLDMLAGSKNDQFCANYSARARK